jgi:ABC-type transport system involved in multi-copper enzyme maturation permease subunit
VNGASPARPRRLDAVEAVWQVAALTVRRSFRGGRFWTALALVLFPLALSFPVGARADARHQEELFYGVLGFYHFGLAVPAVALAFATAFPWPEAEEGTLTWWFTSPVPRWTVHLGRWAAALAVGSLLLPLSVVALVLPLHAGPAADLGTVAWSAAAATLLVYPSYLGLFWLVSTAFRRGLAVGVVYILVENLFSLVEGNLAGLTMIRYVRSFVHPAIPAGSRGRAEPFLLALEPVAAGTSVTVFLAAAAASLVLSLLLIGVVEYRGKSAQAP